MDHEPGNQKYLGLCAECIFDFVRAVYVGWWYLCKFLSPLILFSGRRILTGNLQATCESIVQNYDAVATGVFTCKSNAL